MKQKITKKKTVVKKIKVSALLIKYQKLARILSCNRCCCCNNPMQHGGHFIPQKVMSTRFMILNIHGQCAECNMFRQGNCYIYGKFINDYYFNRTKIQIADYLINLSYIRISYTQKDLKELDTFVNKYLKLNISKLSCKDMASIRLTLHKEQMQLLYFQKVLKKRNM